MKLSALMPVKHQQAVSSSSDGAVAHPPIALAWLLRAATRRTPWCPWPRDRENTRVAPQTRVPETARKLKTD